MMKQRFLDSKPESHAGQTTKMFDAYDRASKAQQRFWDALSDLERLTDLEIDGTTDLADTDLETLLTTESN